MTHTMLSYCNNTEYDLYQINDLNWLFFHRYNYNHDNKAKTMCFMSDLFIKSCSNLEVC